MLLGTLGNGTWEFSLKMRKTPIQKLESDRTAPIGFIFNKGTL